MNSQINLVLTLRLLLLTHVRLVLVVDEVNYRCPAVPVVYVVAEPGAIDDGQLGLELFLLQFSFDDLDFCQFVQLLVVTPGVIFRRGQLGREEGIDKRGLPEARFTCGKIRGRSS